MKYDRKSSVYPSVQLYGPIRQHRRLGIMGWTYVILGALITLAAFFSPSGLAALLFLGVGLLVAGIVAIKIYRNWGLYFYEDRVEHHSMSKRVTQISYAAIREYQVFGTRYDHVARIVSSQGQSINIGKSVVNLAPIIDRIEHYSPGTRKEASN